MVDQPVLEPLFDDCLLLTDFVPDDRVDLIPGRGRGGNAAIRVSGVHPPAHENSGQKGFSDPVARFDGGGLVRQHGVYDLTLLAPQVHIEHVLGPAHRIVEEALRTFTLLSLPNDELDSAGKNA